MTAAIDRFMDRVSPEPMSGCWLWTGWVNKATGYAYFYDAKPVLAHRIAYRLLRGPVSPDLCVLHKCDVKSCVNPEHLFVGTHADNVADKMKKGRHHNSNRTHCRNGHELTGNNLGSGYKRCLQCRRDRYARTGRT